MAEKRRGSGGVYLRGSTYWIYYQRGRKQVRESARSESERDAWNLLDQRRGEIAAGTWLPPAAKNAAFQDARKLLTAHADANNLKSKRRMLVALSWLEKFFGKARLQEIETRHLRAYVNWRLGLEPKPAPASVKYEMAIFRSSLRLARADRLLRDLPEFPRIEVQNARTVFFEDWEFRKVLRELPEHLKAPVTVWYFTGWRREEVLSRQKRHFNPDRLTLHILPGEAKDRDKGRTFPVGVIPELRDALLHQLAVTEALEKKERRVIPWLFHLEGRQIKHFRRSWLTALAAAGIQGKRPHDFRRTAVRNLEHAGVPRSVAKELVGHKTDAMYARYAIVSERDLSEGAEKLGAFVKDVERKVRPLGASKKKKA
ncbi:MAG: tyrosine-type recombinase/integrase [Bdellovibrionota bacterium]